MPVSSVVASHMEILGGKNLCNPQASHKNFSSTYFWRFLCNFLDTFNYKQRFYVLCLCTAYLIFTNGSKCNQKCLIKFAICTLLPDPLYLFYKQTKKLYSSRITT